MDLLLQAAKVLEQENSVGSLDQVSSRSTRGLHLGRTRGESQSEKDDSLGVKNMQALLDDSADDEALSGSERRRAGGAGTREVHNQLEKNRRKQMRECFNYLQQCIPSLENKRVATQSILQGAIKHIKGLKKKNVEQEREIQMLAKRKSELKRKHDVEFNKCTEDQHRMAEVILKMKKPLVDEAMPDEDGHTSDSTTTASEGPGNEDDFSDEEKTEERERGHLSRVNPVVAAKLDGLRKRKLASLDSHPKSTDYIIASMKDAGLLTAPSQKSKVGSLSSVSSSSVALKNMLEQKKKQQSNHFSSGPSIPSSPVVDKVKVTNATAMSKVPSTTASKSGSSLISSHPMISNQLAAMPSLSLSLHNKDAGHIVDSKGSSASNLIQTNVNSVSMTSYPIQGDGSKTVGLDKSDVMICQNSVIYAPTSLTDQTSALKNNRARLHSYSGTTLTEISKIKNDTPSSANQVDLIKHPFDFSSSATGRAVINPNPSSISVIQAPLSSSSGSGATKVLSSVIPMSMLRGLPLNSGLAPMAVTLTPAVSSSTPSSSLDPAVSAVAGASPSILTQKVNQPLASEFLLTSPIKSEVNDLSDLATTPMSRVTALLAPPLATSLPSTILKPPSTLLTTFSAATNLTSTSVPQTNLSLQDTLKTMAITPTLLPLTVTGGPLSTSSTQAVSPMAPALRFYSSIAPNSVVAATPLTNGQTASLMPAVVRLGVLQNFIPAHVQVQSPQMIAQPIVVVTTPSSAAVIGTQPSVSSSSVL